MILRLALYNDVIMDKQNQKLSRTWWRLADDISKNPSWSRTFHLVIYYLYTRDYLWDPWISTQCGSGLCAKFVTLFFNLEKYAWPERSKFESSAKRLSMSKTSESGFQRVIWPILWEAASWHHRSNIFSFEFFIRAFAVKSNILWQAGLLDIVLFTRLRWLYQGYDGRSRVLCHTNCLPVVTSFHGLKVDIYPVDPV